MLGLGLGLTFRPSSGGAPVFDPATLALTGWWRAPFVSAPWEGVTSAGTSGSRDLDGGLGASPGTPVNSLAPASFNGVQYLVGDNLENLFSVSAYTAVMLVKPSGAAAPEVNVYDNDQLMASNPFGQFGIAWSTSGVKGWHDDGLGKKETDWVACPADAWVMVAQTFNGTNIGIQLNNGAATTGAAGNAAITGLGNLPLRVGANYSGNFTTMEVLEVITAASTLSGSDLGNIKDYFAATYALSL